MTGLTSISRILGICDHKDAYVARCVGNKSYGMWCDACNDWRTVALGFGKPWLPKDHPAFKGVDLANVPDVGVKIYRKCQGPCGALTMCQLHHTAPRAFFGEQCDDWPMVWLCTPCHARWHTLVTPGLCTAYDHSAHAAMLIDYLGLERAAVLTRALIDLGRARRVGAA